MLTSHGLLMALEKWKYCLDMWLSTHFEVTEAAHLPLSTLVQQLNYMLLLKHLILADGKTVNIYIESWYPFAVAHGFGMLWKQWGSLLP